MTVRPLRDGRPSAAGSWSGADPEESLLARTTLLLDADVPWAKSMPVTDGLEATRSIRSLETIMGGHVPIIAVTGRAMLGDRLGPLTREVAARQPL